MKKQKDQLLSKAINPEACFDLNQVWSHSHNLVNL